MENISAGMVIYAKDIKRVAEFYQFLLDLEVKHADDEFIKLEANSLQLFIHKLPKPIAASITIETPPKRRSNTAIKPVFFVKEVQAKREPTVKYGGELNAPETEWQFDGYWVCDGYDPEGNIFQLRAAINPHPDR